MPDWYVLEAAPGALDAEALNAAAALRFALPPVPTAGAPDAEAMKEAAIAAAQTPNARLIVGAPPGWDEHETQVWEPALFLKHVSERGALFGSPGASLLHAGALPSPENPFPPSYQFVCLAAGCSAPVIVLGLALTACVRFRSAEGQPAEEAAIRLAAWARRVQLGLGAAEAAACRADAEEDALRGTVRSPYLVCGPKPTALPLEQSLKIAADGISSLTLLSAAWHGARGSRSFGRRHTA